MLKIREASSKDVVVVDLITAMLREILSYSDLELRGEDWVRSQLQARFMESYERQPHAYLVAAVGDPEELAGTVEVSLMSPDGIFSSRPVVHIHSLYVRPRYRREGVGRKLLEEALEWGRGQGCVDAELSVLARNPARELYERMGFKVCEVEMRRDL